MGSDFEMVFRIEGFLFAILFVTSLFYLFLFQTQRGER